MSPMILLHYINLIVTRVLLCDVQLRIILWRRFQSSIADAICIVLFTHFNDTVRNVMSMIKVVARCRWRVAVVVAERCCLATVHALLELIDTQIIIVLMLLVVIGWSSAAVSGLCGPSLRYSWSFCMRSVRRIVVGKMWKSQRLIVLPHIAGWCGCGWWAWKVEKKNF